MANDPATFKREALPQSIEGYQKEALAQTKEQFVGQRPYPFLLFSRTMLWDRMLLIAQASSGSKETSLVNYDMPSGGYAFISPIRKRQTDPNDPAIILGRTKDNDLIVPVASISTRQCSFIKGTSAEAWSVVDLGSTNGTFFKETRLLPDKPTVLQNGDYLRLGGNLIAWFLLPQNLWDVLRKPSELKKLTDL